MQNSSASHLVIAQVNNVHAGLEKTIERMLGRANDRFVFVERGVQDHRYSGQFVEVRDQLVVTGIRSRIHRLQTAGSVNMRDGRDHAMFFAAHWIHHEHRWRGMILLEVFRSVLFKNGWCEWPERLSFFDSLVQNLPHI